MTVPTETLEAPKEIEVLGIEITPAKVATIVAVLQPVILDLAGAWEKMTETQQNISLVFAGACLLAYIVLYGVYVTKRKVAQLQLETNRELINK